MDKLVFYVIVPLLLLIPFELMTYFLHKHVMHGFGWCWHESHHQNPHQHFGRRFERNDYYAICFAVIAIGLFYLANVVLASMWLMSFAMGLTLYGFCYFMVHDVLIHRRIPNKLYAWIKSPYIKRLIRAHAIHHKVKTKHGAEAFGFLYAPKRYAYPKNPSEAASSVNTQQP